MSMIKTVAHRSACPRGLSRGLSDISGGTSVIAAVMAVPLLTLVGFGVDYSNAVRVKSSLQAALDAATLAAARSFATTQGDPTAEVTAYLTENFTAKRGLSPPQVTATADGSGKISTMATVEVPTSFVALINYPKLPVKAESEAMGGTGNIELALVLDNTGSMAGQKLTDLQTAAKGLVTDLFAAPNGATKVKVGVVPFAQYVNVGLAYRNAAWLNVAPDSTTTTNQCWNTYVNPTGCTTTNTTCYSDGVPYSCQSTTCSNPGTLTQVCGPVTYSSTWSGCVGSRAYPLDVQTGADFTTQVPGMVNTSCPSELTRLTNDPTIVNAQIDAFVATGETYIPAGLIWGWRVLAHDGPFGDGVDTTSNKDVRKILVLMTDGENTMSPDYPYHWGNDTVLANNLTKEACTNLKAQGVTIFAVTFGVNSPTAQQVMSDCATGPPYYYQAATASDLTAAFTDIGKSLATARLTK